MKTRMRWMEGGGQHYLEVFVGTYSEDGPDVVKIPIGYDGILPTRKEVEEEMAEVLRRGDWRVVANPYKDPLADIIEVLRKHGYTVERE